MKWSKKLCIEALTQMKSPIENQSPASPDNLFQSLLTATKARQAEGAQPEVIMPPSQGMITQ